MQNAKRIQQTKVNIAFSLSIVHSFFPITRCILECTWNSELEKLVKINPNINCIPHGVALNKKSIFFNMPVCTHRFANETENGAPGKVYGGKNNRNNPNIHVLQVTMSLPQE